MSSSRIGILIEAVRTRQAMQANWSHGCRDLIDMTSMITVLDWKTLCRCPLCLKTVSYVAGLKAADNMLRMTTSSSGPLLTKLAGIRGLKIIALQGPCSARLSQRHAAFFGVRTQALSTSCVPQHAKVCLPIWLKNKQLCLIEEQANSC